MQTPIILSEQEIYGHLPHLSHWSYKNDKLVREYEFKSFIEGIRFIDDISAFFEKIHHHADMHIHYTKIIFELNTADVGGKVTNLDFEAAKEIEKRFQVLHSMK